MIPNGFVAAVTASVKRDADELWQSEYYCGASFPANRLATYMQSCEQRLGPEWSELIRCTNHMVLASRGISRRSLAKAYTDFLVLLERRKAAKAKGAKAKEARS